MSNLHTELYPALANVTTKIHGVNVELGQTLAHFATQVSPKLNDEERTSLAAILDAAYTLQPVPDNDDGPKHQMALGGGSGPASDSADGQSALRTL